MLQKHYERLGVQQVTMQRSKPKSTNMNAQTRPVPSGVDPLAEFTKAQLRSELPDVHPGDTVRITQKVREGDRERLQSFEGLVIARKHGRGISATITVRRVSAGIGVERTFPIHSPTIEKLEVLKGSNVRRAKLYYIRAKAAKEARRKVRAKAPEPAGAGEGENQ